MASIKLFLFIVLLSCTYLAHMVNGNVGKVTTWKDDPTGHDCLGYQQCDTGAKLCSAPMRACKCQSGQLKPAKDTGNNNRFKWWCSQSNIDGKSITPNDRAKCMSCTVPTCDQWDYPSCKDLVNCGQQICVNVNGHKVQTFEMDSCPSNHQKNVAKCCMWGGDYCSCIKGGDWLDVNKAAMQRLGCGSLCKNASWNTGTCPSQSPFVNPTHCVDVPPPGSFTCQQQRQWGKCRDPWMQGYCKKTCGRC